MNDIFCYIKSKIFENEFLGCLEYLRSLQYFVLEFIFVVLKIKSKIDFYLVIVNVFIDGGYEEEYQ